jgi:hypothetical protein
MDHMNVVIIGAGMCFLNNVASHTPPRQSNRLVY